MIEQGAPEERSCFLPARSGPLSMCGRRLTFPDIDGAATTLTALQDSERRGAPPAIRGGGCSGVIGGGGRSSLGRILP